jgi:4-hydroxy-tetrahydrodipicolinate reductase
LSSDGNDAVDAGNVYQVVGWSTGRVGRQAVRDILAHPQLELIGLWVSSDAKADRDAGELCGLATCGVIATRDVDALLSLGADCVLYTATDTLREDEVIADLCRILRSGVNVVSTSFAALVEPSALPDVAAELAAACADGQSSVHFTGIHPGFALDFLPAVTASLSASVTGIALFEMWNVSAYDDAFILRDVLGFGLSQDEHTARHELISYGVGRFVKPAIAMLGRLLDAEIDDIESSVSGLVTDHAFDIPSLHIPEGTVTGTSVEYRGLSAGRTVVTLDEYLCVGPRDEWPSAWPQPPGAGGGYRFELRSPVPVRVDMSFPGDAPSVLQAVKVTAARAANFIPAVCDAAPGVHTFDTLPHVVGTNRSVSAQ